MLFRNWRDRIQSSDLPTPCGGQVVRCGPDNAFSASLRGTVGKITTSREATPGTPTASTTPAGGGAGTGAGGASPGTNDGGSSSPVGDRGELRWAAGPPMEVALLKQSEKDVSEQKGRKRKLNTMRVLAAL